MHYFMKKMKDSKEHEWWNAYMGFFGEAFSSDQNDIEHYFTFLKYCIWKLQQVISKFHFVKTEWSAKSKNDTL